MTQDIGNCLEIHCCMAHTSEHCV